MRIVVTGASGELGGRLARRLSAGGGELVLVGSAPGRVPALPGAVEAVATYDQPDALRAAFAGADVVFLVSAREHPDRIGQHRAAVDAAVAAGAARIVYTSFLHASPDATFTLARDHAATEAHLRDCGTPFTALRNSMYQDMFPLLVGADGIIRGPAGDGRVSAVTRDDIADVAEAVIRDGSGRLDGVALDVTGPQALSLAEVAAQLSAVTGRGIGYHAESVPEAYESRAVYGAPRYELDGWVTSYTAIAAGELAAVSDTVPRLAGRPATTFAQFLERNPDAWAGLAAG